MTRESDRILSVFNSCRAAHADNKEGTELVQDLVCTLRPQLEQHRPDLVIALRLLMKDRDSVTAMVALSLASRFELRELKMDAVKMLGEHPFYSSAKNQEYYRTQIFPSLLKRLS